MLQKTTNAPEKNQSSPRRLACSCQGPVPWQVVERQEERLHPYLEGGPWVGDVSLVLFLCARALGYAALTFASDYR